MIQTYIRRTFPVLGSLGKAKSLKSSLFFNLLVHASRVSEFQALIATSCSSIITFSHLKCFSFPCMKKNILAELLVVQ